MGAHIVSHEERSLLAQELDFQTDTCQRTSESRNARTYRPPRGSQRSTRNHGCSRTGAELAPKMFSGNMDRPRDHCTTPTLRRCFRRWAKCLASTSVFRADTVARPNRGRVNYVAPTPWTLDLHSIESSDAGHGIHNDVPRQISGYLCNVDRHR